MSVIEVVIIFDTARTGFRWSQLYWINEPPISILKKLDKPTSKDNLIRMYSCVCENQTK